MAESFIKTSSCDRSRTIYTLAFITGLICIVGFGLDTIAISLGPKISSIEWRMGYMQQLGEYSIILLFGLALLGFSLQTNPKRLKGIAWFCCGAGLCFSLSSFLYLQDSLQFSSLAIENLSIQQQKLEQKIQQFIPQPGSFPESVVDPAKKEQALELLQERTVSLQSNAKIRIQKTMVRTFSSLSPVGSGLVSLGVVMLSPRQLFKVDSQHKAIR